jgi:hypothetical protein
MHARIRLVVLVLITLFIPSVGSAQQANAQAAPATGPTIDAVVTGFRAPSQTTDSTLLLQRTTRSERQSIALMIVGGAAVVLGAVIGDDVGTLFMIGGAVALLIGLYKYLS